MALSINSSLKTYQFKFIYNDNFQNYKFLVPSTWPKKSWLLILRYLLSNKLKINSNQRELTSRKITPIINHICVLIPYFVHVNPKILSLFVCLKAAFNSTPSIDMSSGILPFPLGIHALSHTITFAPWFPRHFVGVHLVEGPLGMFHLHAGPFTLRKTPLEDHFFVFLSLRKLLKNSIPQIFVDFQCIWFT